MAKLRHVHYETTIILSFTFDYNTCIYYSNIHNVYKINLFEQEVPKKRIKVFCSF